MCPSLAKHKNKNSNTKHFILDGVAGRPFDRFLDGNNCVVDRRYLGFWSDVRRYLDTDDSQLDCYGQRMKEQLARMIMARYLTSTAADVEIFSEGLKLTLYRCLGGTDDESLLCTAQDIVTGVSFIN